ncbi:MAG: protease modulator HflC [Mariprofundaceae bacterium]|nr:protease modulator HflC [Mariprofundaceae bacterium]
MGIKSTLFIGILVFLTSTTTFVVDQREQALILQFGNPKDVVTEAGLHFKFPWRSVTMFDKRLLESDAMPNEVITEDKKTLLVDNYTRWKIIDPLMVYQVARTQEGVASRMQDIVRGKVREVLGQHTLHEIISGGLEENLRKELMLSIRERADEAVKDLGIKVVDVRIKRAELPQENSNAVFSRMKAERQRIAREYRSEGEEAAREIRAEAEKATKILIADAYRNAEVIRGRADAKVARIFAEVHKKDPEFYAFMRSLKAYRTAIGEGTRLVISPNSEFFRYFEQADR